MIHDAPSPADAFVVTRFYPDVDRDLDALAMRYGTTARDLAAFAVDHDPDRSVGTADLGPVIARIASGDPFALEVPAAEQRYTWGLYENAAGHEVSLADVASEINARPTSLPQPRVSASLLWSYAANAAVRAGALHGRSEGERHSFDAEPDRALIAAGVSLRFPMVAGATAESVCAASGCSIPVSPAPPWLPSYHHQLREVERLSSRLEGILRHIEHFHRAGVTQVGRIDFLVNLTHRLDRDVMARLGLGSSTLHAVADALLALRNSAQEHIVMPSVEHLRPTWFTHLEREAAELEGALSDPQLNAWHALLITEGSSFDRDGLLAAAHQVMATATRIFGESDTAAARRFFACSLRYLDGEELADGLGNILVTYTRNWSAVWSAVVAGVPLAITDSPGPPSVMSAMFTMQMFYTLRSTSTTVATIDQRRSVWRQMLMEPLSPADQAAITAALETGALDGRAVAGLAIYRAALGRAANGLGALFAMFALATTICEADRDHSAWETLGTLISGANGGLGVAFASLGFESSSLLARNALAPVFPRLAGASGATALNQCAGVVLGALAFIQGLYMLADATLFTEEADQRGSIIIAGALTMVGGLVTVIGASMCIPGMQVLGLVLAVGAVVAAAWPHDADNVKALVDGLVRAFQTEPANAATSDGARYNPMLAELGPLSFYCMVTLDYNRGPTTHPLAVALHRALDAIEAWPGHAFRDTTDNRAYFGQYHLPHAFVDRLVD